MSINTEAGSVIVAKRSGPGAFAGTYTFGRSGRIVPVGITRASLEQVQQRVKEELDLSRQGEGFRQENKDWGIAASEAPRTDRLHSPTPRSIPGARTLTTLELFHLLPPVLIDVLDGQHTTIRGSHWMPGAGAAAGRAELARFSAALEKLTGGDKDRLLVFFCLSSECWLSYNATLRARDFGYKNVGWYRGGTMAWQAADFPRVNTSKESW